MATYIKTMKDINGDIVLPQTNTKAVYSDDGSRLDNILDNILDGKLNKETSGWINLPLNGWSGYIRIRKDSLGNVSLVGAIYGGTISFLGKICTLPEWFNIPGVFIPINTFGANGVSHMGIAVDSSTRELRFYHPIATDKPTSTLHIVGFWNAE